MSIEFLKPIWLVLIPVALLYILWTAKNKIHFRFQRNLFSLLRILVSCLLILAMAGPTVTKEANITTTIFAVDCSSSTEGEKRKMEAFLKQAQENREKTDWMGIVCFGRKAVLEQTPSAEEMVSGNFLSYVEKDATNIESALQMSDAIFSPNTKRRIVLVSDGIQTEGDLLQAGNYLKNRQTAVDVFPLFAEEKPEVQLSKMELPKVVNKNTDYDITLDIASNLDVSGQVRLYKGNTMIADEKVQLIDGTNHIVFTDRTQQGGDVTYRAEIIADTDTISRNNQVYAYCYITDVPQVLLLEKEESGALWKEILQNTQVNLTVQAPENAPVAMEKLGAYDGVILADVSMEDLPKDFPEALAAYLKTTGGGCIVSAGENSLALGGYQNTKLEEILPVDMEIKTEGESPNLAMVMVIDRSGSMEGGQYGISKMEMAKEAVIRSFQGFQPRDSVGVIAFDSIPNWVIDIQQVGENASLLAQHVAMIQPQGGTSILPALKEAYVKINEVDAGEKHIILLTDGQAEQTGYESVMQNMRDADITLSTIAVGSDTDTKLLKSLADQGGGRYYFTNEFSDLPEIFAKETMLAGKDYINHRTFYPQTKDSSPIMEGIEQIGELEGYIASTEKPRADVVLKSDTDDPILATWQYGLGRSAVWTSDMAGQWTKNWFTNQEGVQILQNTFSWILKKEAEKAVTVEAEIQGEKSVITVSMPYDKEITSLSGTAISSDYQEYEVKLVSTAPGVYKGKMDTVQEGAYLLHLVANKKDGTEELLSSGFHLPYPKEYDIRLKEQGEKQLLSLTKLTGGRMLTDGKDVFSQEAAQVYAPKELSALCLVVGLLLFLVDIAFRRFPFLVNRMEAIVETAGSSIKKVKAKEKKKGNKGKNQAVQMVKQPVNGEEKMEMDKGAKKEAEAKKATTAQKLAQAKRKRER